MRRVFLLIGIAIAIAGPFLAGPAAAQKRIALVIGNGQYQHEGQLINPANDAREVAAALWRIKFDDVQLVLNGDLIAMQTALAAFARRANPADLALIYYSGHGIEVDGRNYLLPTSAKLDDAGDVDFEAVPLDLAMTAADRAGKIKMIVLDACRNNPFQMRMLKRQEGKRSIGRGLAAPSTANGMLVAYAARAGTTADDGAPGGTSPFTSAFLKFVEQPRVEVRLLFGRIRDEVVRETKRQEPGIYVSLGGDEVYLNPVAASQAVATSTAAASTLPHLTEAERQWARIEGSDDVAIFEAFRRQYGRQNAVLDALAANKIAALKRAEAQKQAALQQPAPTIPKAAAAPKAVPPPATAIAVRDQVFRDCPECPQMIVVPDGTFKMGSPVAEAGRKVDETEITAVIPNPFAVGIFSVTFAEWDACVADDGCNRYRPNDEGWGRGSRPVVNVSWNDAKAYVSWLSRKTGKVYGLPSEVEREYFTRAGSTTPFSTGESIDSSQANYNGSGEPYGRGGVKGEFRQRTMPVDFFSRPNAWGIYQVHGNIWEWTEDCYRPTNSRASSRGNGGPAGACAEKAVRGGAWGNDAVNLRSADRHKVPSNGRFNSLGFRVVRAL